MSRAYLHCLTHEQRPRGMDKASISPGSRRSAPWTLRSKRGLPQFTHTPRSTLEECATGPGSVRKCPGCVDWRVRALRAKTAAFLDATARCSALPHGKAGVSGRAYRRIQYLLFTTACRRQARTGTVPPFSPLIPKPP